jgi:succinoglycan biosynthesis protein ExoM
MDARERSGNISHLLGDGWGTDGGGVPESYQRIAVCVCTYKRPVMLQRCLSSLAAQHPVDGMTAEVVVVDNEEDGSNAVRVGDLAGRFPMPLHYVHQPKRGISAARNAAIETALYLGVDWIAFIDDDEVAAPAWLSQLFHPDYVGTPILMGRQIIDYPEPRPFWCVDREKRPRAEGKAWNTAYTNNVRFPIGLVRAGLRFDETLGLMGGEDQRFFTAAHKMGFAMRQTQRAVTFETAHAERLSYRAQLGRAYWTAASNLMRLEQEGEWRTYLRKIAGISTNAIWGLAELVTAPLFVVAGLTAFKRRAVAGGKKVARSAGRPAALIGAMPAPYRRIAGC